MVTPQIVQEKFYSVALRREKRVNVVLPTKYGNENHSVLFLLHGFGGNRDSWIQNTDLLSLIRPYDLIVVLPESGRRWFINDIEGYRYEDYLVRELIAFVDSKFRTLPNRGERAIAGFSMGGAAAVFQAFRHPELFSVVASHAGAFEAPLRVGDPYENLRWNRDFLMPTVEMHERVWGPVGSPIRCEYDPSLILSKSDERFPFSLYLDVGKDDYERVLQMNRNFHNLLRQCGIDHEYHEVAGGHDWQYLDHAFRASLEFIVSRFQSRTPAKSLGRSNNQEKEK